MHMYIVTSYKATMHFELASEVCVARLYSKDGFFLIKRTSYMQHAKKNIFNNNNHNTTLEYASKLGSRKAEKKSR